jgi:hypothetical protein
MGRWPSTRKKKDNESATDHSDSTQEVEEPKWIRKIPVENIIVDDVRRPVSETILGTMKNSIRLLGLINPILVHVDEKEGGREEVRLVAGWVRLNAVKQLGLPEIECIVFESDGGRMWSELAQIAENIIRHDHRPARLALWVGRLDEVYKKHFGMDSTVSQNETSSKQAMRAAGLETGPDVGSLRYVSEKTGESKDKIQRSRSRFRELGDEILKAVENTCLDSGTELDALMKCTETERWDLAHNARSGKVVSARHRQDPGPVASDHKYRPSREKALAVFRAWKTEFSGLEELAGLGQQISDIESALSTDPSDGR